MPPGWVSKACRSQIEMDHAAIVSFQLRASVSQADELCETPAAGLSLSEDGPDEVLFEHIARGTQEALVS
jgi:hypothetical protein